MPPGQSKHFFVVFGPAVVSWAMCQPNGCFRKNCLGEECINPPQAPDELVETVDNFLVCGLANGARLEFKNLTTIEGSMDVSANPGLVEIHMPALSSVGWEVAIDGNPELEIIDMPLLERTGGNFSIGSNNNLAEVTLPSLKAIGPENWFEIAGNPKLPNCEAMAIIQQLYDACWQGYGTAYDNDMAAMCVPNEPRMVVHKDTDLVAAQNAAGEVAGLTICGLDGGERLDFEGLTRIKGPMLVRMNPGLVEIHMPVLTSIGGWATTTVNPLLEIIDMPLLEQVGENFTVVGNDRLMEVRLPSLKAIGPKNWLNIYDNPKLPNCQVQAIIQQMRDAGWQGYASMGNNDMTAVCP